MGALYNQLDLKDSVNENFEHIPKLDRSSYKAYENLGNIYSKPNMLNVKKAGINFKQALKYH